MRGAGAPSAPCPASSAKPSMGGRRSRDMGRGAIWCSRSAMRVSLQGSDTSEQTVCHAGRQAVDLLSAVHPAESL